jgi:hypothetical protein
MPETLLYNAIVLLNYLVGAKTLSVQGQKGQYGYSKVYGTHLRHVTAGRHSQKVRSMLTTCRILRYGPPGLVYVVNVPSREQCQVHCRSPQDALKP